MKDGYTGAVVLANQLRVRIERLEKSSLDLDYVANLEVHMHVVEAITKPYEWHRGGQRDRRIYDRECDGELVRSFARLWHRVAADNLQKPIGCILLYESIDTQV